jgi:hypothetical protein
MRQSPAARPAVAAAVAFAVAATLALLAAPARANTSHHHLGGGSSGGDDDADCLRWELVYLTPDGAVVSDAGAPDAADDAGDAGSSSNGGLKAVMRCVEHATLFGCDCALPPGRLAGGTAGALAALLAGAALARRRGARGRRP